MQRLQKPLFLSVLFGIALYLVAMFFSDFQSVKEAMAKVGWTGWSIILSLSLANYLLRFLRWQWYLRKLSRVRIPRRLHIAYYFCGFALSTTPGKAGETVRSFYLKQHGVALSDTFSTFFVERFQDLLSVILIASAAAFLFEGYQVLVGMALAVVILCLPLLHSTFFVEWLRGLSQSGPLKLRNGFDKLLTLLSSSTVLLRSKALFGGLTVGLIAWFLEAVGFWYLLQLLGQDVGLLQATSIYGVAVLIGAISFLPGGLGSTEAVMGVLLISLGVPDPIAVAATLICRIATLWFAVLIGLGTTGLLALRGITPVYSTKKEVT